MGNELPPVLDCQNVACPRASDGVRYPVSFSDYALQINSLQLLGSEYTPWINAPRTVIVRWMAASPKKKKRHPVAIAFGVALRASRIRANRTQEALGLSCGLDRTYVSLLERGINQPTLGTILLLADELETSAEGLVTETRKALGQAGARQEVASRGQGAAARHKAAGVGRGTAQRSRTKGRARPKSARS